eukprot:768041-Hanusia_phi.AAC.5
MHADAVTTRGEEQRQGRQRAQEKLTGQGPQRNQQHREQQQTQQGRSLLRFQEASASPATLQ